VEEANLAVNISMLRKALGERPDGGLYIETLPRRGYRFAAEVAEFWDERSPSSVTAITPAVVERAIEEKPVAESGIAPLSSQQAIEPHGFARLRALVAARRAIVIAFAFVIFIALIVAAYLIFARRGDPRSAAQTKRLAVLPFANNRPDSQTDYLGFALADSVINRLD